VLVEEVTATVLIMVVEPSAVELVAATVLVDAELPHQVVPSVDLQAPSATG